MKIDQLATEGASALTILRRAGLGALLATVCLALSACGGCGPDDEDPCEGVVCESGVCGTDDGVCINADDCAGDPGLCLEGYSCGADGECTADVPCNGIDTLCDRGTCQVGACVEPETCAEDDDCLEGRVCGDGGACEDAPCSSVTCERGVCEAATGDCIDATVCTEATQEVDCLEGSICQNQACVTTETFCAGLDCQRGECSIEARACVDATDCGGDDTLCLEGNYCDAADNTCKLNECPDCQRGECSPPMDACVNPSSCGSSADCLDGNLCVESACVVEAEACGAEGCPGNQVCFYEEGTLTAGCIENADELCVTAQDCIDARVCDAGACSPPPVCTQDIYEANDTDADATDYFVARGGAALDVNVCANDVDVYAFDTAQDLDGIGTLTVEIEIPAVDDGLGELDVEIVNPMGTVVANGAASGAAPFRLTTDVTITRQGVYLIRVSAASNVSAAGVRYRMYADVVDPTVITACEMPTMLAADTVEMASTLSGASFSLSASCHDLTGEAAEDIYAIEVTTKSQVTVTATPGMMSDVGVSLRSECLRDTSELTGACADSGIDGEVETLTALVEPGTYYIVVQGRDTMTGGTYSVEWSSAPVVCTSAENSCVSADSAQACLPDGTGFVTEMCEQGCNMGTGECNRNTGDLCDSATMIALGQPIVGAALDWDRFRDDYAVAPNGCLPASDDGSYPVNGPDIAWAVTIGPDEALVASLDGDTNDTSLYLIADCADPSLSCEVAANADGDVEELFHHNTTGTTQTFFLVADVAQAATYTDATFNAEVVSVICTPGAPECTVDTNGDPASRICNATGTDYEPAETCNYGCDAATGICLNPPNDLCTGATALTSGTPLSAVIDDFTSTNPLTTNACTGFSTSGPDAVYSIDAQAGDIIDVVLDAGFDSAVWISDSCDMTTQVAGQCLAGSDSGNPETIQIVAPTTGTYYIVAMAFSSFGSGSFTLTATAATPECTPGQAATCNGADIEFCDDVGFFQTYTCATTCTGGICDDPTGDVCIDPQVLAGTTGTLTGQAFGTTNSIEIPSFDNFGRCANPDFSTSSNERVYSIALTQGDLVEFSLTNAAPDAQLYVLSNCADIETCEGGLEGNSSVEVFVEQTGVYSVIVDGPSGVTGTFDLNWTLVNSGLVCRPNERYCADPFTSAQCNVSGTAPVTSVTCPGACAAGGYCDVTSADQDVCTTVAMGTAIGTGLTAALNYGDLTDDFDLGSSSCLGRNTGSTDAFFRVDLQPDEILEAEVFSPGSTTYPSIYVFTDCAMPEATCLGGEADTGDDLRADTRYVNSTGTTQTVLVGVDGDLNSSNDMFVSLSVRQPECAPGAVACQPATGGAVNDTLRSCNAVGLFEDYECDGTCGVVTPGRCDNPTGAICADALPLAGLSGQLVGQTWSGTNDYLIPAGSGTCSVARFSEPDGPDTVYSIELQADDLLDVTLSSSSSSAYAFITSGCEASQCIDSVRTGQVSFQAPTAGTYYVIVDSSDASPTATYDLTWQVRTGLTCAPGGVRCANASELGVCSGNGTAETLVPCPGTCTDGACDIADYTPFDICSTVAAGLDIGQGISLSLDFDDAASTDDVSLSTFGGCVGASTTGNEFFQKIVVGPGEVLKARVQINGSGFETPRIYAIEDCANADTTCVAGDAGQSGDLDAEIAWTNDTGMATTLIIGVESSSSFADDPVEVVITKGAPECTPGTIACSSDATTIESCNDGGVYELYACDGTCGTITPSQCDTPRGDACFDAITLASTGGQLLAQSFSGTNRYELAEGRTEGCFIPEFDENDAADTFYTIDVPANAAVEFDLDTDSTGAYLFVLRGDCAANTCVTNNPLRGSTSLSTFSPTAERLTVVVDGSFASSETYDLTWTVTQGAVCAPSGFRCVDANTLGVCDEIGSSEAQTPCATGCVDGACAPDNANQDTCLAAEAGLDVGAGISVFGTYQQSMPALGTDDVSLSASSCVGSSTPGTDAFYKVTVAPNEILQVHLDSFEDEDPAIYVFEACADAEGTCLAGATEALVTGRAEVLWANQTAAAKTVLVAADSTNSSASGAYALAISKRQPECTPGLTQCDLTPGPNDDLLTCSSIGLFERYTCAGGCGTFTAGQCDTPTGNACADPIIIVGPSGSETGSFDGPDDLVTLPGGRSGGCFVDEFDITDGADTVYAIDLVAGDVLRASLTTNFGDATLQLFEDCGQRNSCITSTTEFSNSVSYYAVQSRRVFLVVDGFDSSTEAFTLDYEVLTGLLCAPRDTRCIDGSTQGVCSDDGLVESAVACACADGACVADPLVGDSCATASAATPILGAFTAFGGFAQGSDDIDLSTPNCTGDDSPGNDTFWSVQVATGDAILVRAESYFGESVSVYMITDCATPDASCVAGGEDFDEVDVAWVNDTGAVANIVIGVDSSSSFSNEPYALFVEIATPECIPGEAVCNIDGTTLDVCNTAGLYEPYACDGLCGTTTPGRCDNPTGDICLDTVSVNPGGATTLPTTYTFNGVAYGTLTNASGLGNASGCTPFDSAGGPERIYEVVLNDGETLDVDQTARGGGDGVLYLLEDCGDGGLSCVAGADGFTATESITFTNTSGMTKTYFLVADTFFSTTDTIDLSITIR